jgi:hypothetical protein
VNANLLCHIGRRKIQKEEMTKPQPIIQLYQQLAATKTNIDRMLPRFQDMVMMLEYV